MTITREQALDAALREIRVAALRNYGETGLTEEQRVRIGETARAALALPSTPTVNADMLAALKSAGAYLEAQRCWLKSDANPAVVGQPLHVRESAAEQVSAELATIYAAIARAERDGNPTG